MLNNWDVLQTRFNPQEEPTRSLLQLLPFPCTTTFTRKAYDHNLCFPYRVSLLDRLHHAVMHTHWKYFLTCIHLTHRSHSKVRSSLRSARCYTCHCRKLLAYTYDPQRKFYMTSKVIYLQRIYSICTQTRTSKHTHKQTQRMH